MMFPRTRYTELAHAHLILLSMHTGHRLQLLTQQKNREFHFMTAVKTCFTELAYAHLILLSLQTGHHLLQL